MDDIIETSTFDETEGKMVVKTTYDSSHIITLNKEAQKAAPEGFGKFKGNLAHVGRIHMGDVIRLKNIGYNLLSCDPDEKRRALCYIQENEPHLLTVPGKPFARQRKKWR